MKSPTAVLLAAHRPRRVRRAHLVVERGLRRRRRARSAAASPEQYTTTPLDAGRPRSTGLVSIWLPGGVRPDQDRRSPATSATTPRRPASSPAAQRPAAGHDLPRSRRRSRTSTPDELEAATGAAARPSIAKHYLELPGDFPADLRQPGRSSITADGRHAVREGARCCRTGSATTSPTTSTCPPATATNAIDTLPRRSARGYCEQFAGTFAAFARSLGLPARVAVGFTPGDAARPTGSTTSRASTPTPGPRCTSPASAGCRSSRRPAAAHPGAESYTGVPRSRTASAPAVARRPPCAGATTAPPRHRDAPLDAGRSTAAAAVAVPDLGVGGGLAAATAAGVDRDGRHRAPGARVLAGLWLLRRPPARRGPLGPAPPARAAHRADQVLVAWQRDHRRRWPVRRRRPAERDPARVRRAAARTTAPRRRQARPAWPSHVTVAAYAGDDVPTEVVGDADDIRERSTGRSATAPTADPADAGGPTPGRCWRRLPGDHERRRHLELTRPSSQPSRRDRRAGGSGRRPNSARSCRRRNVSARRRRDRTAAAVSLRA